MHCKNLDLTVKFGKKVVTVGLRDAFDFSKKLQTGCGYCAKNELNWWLLSSGNSSMFCLLSTTVHFVEVLALLAVLLVHSKYAA